ncbi:gliding motility-associated C-terminal domain-containing protein [Ferruginibacter sp. HRS2-29]|uniref:T9SS type B sorting domain-containing protein n=1 Tax=Ferruginibacter sp. HRS2-29 TaxID=2487334 RepID=UPI0020CBFDE6|nr:gliding motility-associated C-terminal domain-containing protein [Ferruginibacter sp. HRS2-29]MCP9750667.1 PKD domain-containing protein [Ferruginibacter sp. HRS2-29]
MVKKLLILFISFALISRYSQAQPCSLPGMTPSSAIPVCGTSQFKQPDLANCTGQAIAIRGCTITATSDRAFWYKFTCFQSGTLGFVIKGLNAADDYDWCLFDITGRDPNEVFTNSALQVSLNLYGVGAETSPPFPQTPTGCVPAGTGDVHCEGAASSNSPFNRMPVITVGRQYLLMVNNFTVSTDGYTLDFTGGTASITDPKLPALLSGEAACDAKQIRILLNKDMKCKSMAANGSDFSINAPGINIIGAASSVCTNGFDMDSLILTLDTPLPPGTYTVTAKRGGDGNTLLDNCDREVPVGDKVSFTVFPLIPTPMDSLTKVKCAPRTLELVFKKQMLCSSIAANGSDFEVIGGPVPVTISSAAGVNCTNGLSKKILVTLSAPMQVGGFYTIRLKNGTDGNSIFDECSQQTPVGSNITFEVKDTVNADFTYNIIYGCDKNVVQYTHNGANGVNNWKWLFDNSITNSTPNPVIPYTDYRQKLAQLIVTNGVCSDTSKTTIFFDNLLIADFEVTSIVCPNEPAKFVNKTIGRITEWNWVFDNGNTSSVRNPSPQTYVPRNSGDYAAAPRLIVKNDYGCYDTLSRPVRVVFSCYIAVPKAFTPNGDGVNDHLYPLSAYKAQDLHFSVYNRFGQLVFSTTDWTKQWDGRFKGQGADPGTYVWVLNYFDSITGRRVNQKGTSVLIR